MARRNITRRSSCEDIAVSERSEHREPASAATFDHDSGAIDTSFITQMECCSDTIIDIGYAPTTIQCMPIGPAVTGASAIIHVDHGESPARPVPDAQLKFGTGPGCGPAMCQHQQRRKFVGGRRDMGMCRSVEPAVGFLAIGRGEHDVFRCRQKRRVEAQVTSSSKYLWL